MDMENPPVNDSQKQVTNESTSTVDHQVIQSLQVTTDDKAATITQVKTCNKMKYYIDPIIRALPSFKAFNGSYEPTLLNIPTIKNRTLKKKENIRNANNTFQTQKKRVIHFYNNFNT
jgi:hypothetical protein